MIMEGSDTWYEEHTKAFKHNRCLLMQELGNNYYKLYENNDSEGEDEEQTMIRIEWGEEEEKANKEYFNRG